MAPAMKRLPFHAVAALVALGLVAGCKKPCVASSPARYVARKLVGTTLPKAEHDAVGKALSGLTTEGRVCEDRTGSSEIVFARGDWETAVTALEGKLGPIGWRRRPGPPAQQGLIAVTYEKQLGVGADATTHSLGFFVFPSREGACRSGTVCIK